VTNQTSINNMTDSNKPYSFNPSTVVAAVPTYKQVAITPILPTSKLITLAGQCGIDPSTSNVPPSTGDRAKDFTAQAKQAYINVFNCLKAAGATPRDIIFVRHYIVKETGDASLDALEVVERGWGDLWCEFMDSEGEGHRPPDTVLVSIL
jgi:enamine deaminase RidA (YjgF/YER057c/UK114 family)